MTQQLSLTEQINISNVENVRRQIYAKQGCVPVYGTSTNVKSINTDMDNFPYQRFYRGQYDSSVPIVFEREAGARIVNNECYNADTKCDIGTVSPNHCFEAACSVVFPCTPENLSKYSDRDALNVQLNKRCIVQYR